MKKVCCILLLCCSLFVCLFSTIPKNKVSANTITGTQEKISTYFPYYAPQNIEFMYSDYSLNYTYDYSYDYYGSTNLYNPHNYYTSELVYGAQSLGFFDYFTQIYWAGDVNSTYWTDVGNTYNNDSYYETRLFFESTPASNNDMVINFEFPVHSYDPVLLKQLYGTNLFSVDFDVDGCPALITYDLYFTYPGRANAGDTSNYETHRYVDSYSTEINSGYNDLTIFNTSRFYGLITQLPFIHERIINIYGSVTLTLYDYQDYLINEGDFSPKFQTLSHDIRSYNTTELLENYGGGSFPNLFIENGYFNPNGLPSGGGSSDNSNFIPNIASSLLEGVNNFMAFELVPGFTLAGLFALIVGIPLVIFILKLFLGG